LAFRAEGIGLLPLEISILRAVVLPPAAGGLLVPLPFADGAGALGGAIERVLWPLVYPVEHVPEGAGRRSSRSPD
jgi:hypothetical protein